MPIVYNLYFILFSHYKKKGYVKGHQNNPSPLKFQCAPSFEIPGSDTGVI